MTKKELNDKREKLVHDAQDIMLRANGDKAETEKATKLLDEADAISEAIKTQERLDGYAKSNTVIPRAAVSSDEVRVNTVSADELRANATKELREFLRYGTRPTEGRALTISADGSFFVPTGVAAPTFAQLSAGYIYNQVDHLQTATGEPMNLPLVNMTQSSEWVNNASNIATSDPSVSAVTCSVTDFRLQPILIDFSLVQDSAFDLISFIYNGASQQYLRKVSSLITLGSTADSSIAGVMDGLVPNISATLNAVSSGNVGWEDFSNLLGALDPSYQQDAVFTMNNATLGKVLGLTSTTGVPLFQAWNQPVGSQGFVGTILGRPVKVNQYLPNVGGSNAAVQFGDFSEAYKFREVFPAAYNGVEGVQPGAGYPFVLRRLNERYAELGQVGIVGFARIGGRVTINSGAASPVISLI